MIPVHVLVVEDEDLFANVIEYRLSLATKLRCVVTRVKNCGDMQQMLSLKNFDVILLDLTLPDSHGVDTVTSAVRIAPNTPIVVLSGHEDMEVATVALRAGAQDFVVKKDELTVDDLERPMLYAIVRVKNEQDSKRLYKAARSSIYDKAPSGVLPEMIAPYIDRIENMIWDLLHTLQKNSKASAETMEAKLEEYNFFRSIKDLRGTLKMEEFDRPSRRDTTFVAASVLAELTDRDTPIPQTRADAEKLLLEVLGGDVDLPSEGGHNGFD